MHHAAVTLAAPVTRCSLATPIQTPPQACASTAPTHVATATGTHVGDTTPEAKTPDSITHEVLAAAVDRRVGRGDLVRAE